MGLRTRLAKAARDSGFWWSAANDSEVGQLDIKVGGDITDDSKKQGSLKEAAFVAVVLAVLVVLVAASGGGVGL